MWFPRTNAQRLRVAGIALFALSFAPGWVAFVRTPEFAFREFAYGGRWNHTLIAFALAVGWLDNFTVFFRLPRSTSWLAILAPWLLYFALMFLDYSSGVETSWPKVSWANYWPFYPWALGIGLIHGSRLLEPTPKEIPRTAWTGF